MWAILRGLSVVASLVGLGAWVSGDNNKMNIGNNSNTEGNNNSTTKVPILLYVLGFGVLLYIGMSIYKFFKNKSKK